MSVTSLYDLTPGTRVTILSPDWIAGQTGTVLDMTRCLLNGHDCAVVGGVGTASGTVNGVTVGVLAVVNSFGDVRDPTTGRIVAGARESATSKKFVDAAKMLREGTEPPFPSSSHTTLVLAVTDAELTPASCDVVGRQASAGFARAIYPVFGEYDGDVLIMASSGGKKLHRTILGELAAEVIAEAIVRGVMNAHAVGDHPASTDLLAR